MARILLVDDEPSILHLLVGLLREQEYDVSSALGADRAQSILQTETFDLLISDIKMKPIDGLELLKFARTVCPHMAVVMMTAYGSVEEAVESMRQGSFDYVTKPFNPDELLLTIQRALEFQSIRTEYEKLRLQLNAGFGNMIATSEPMRKICKLVKQIAPTNETVLIGGESGTGKEVIAKAIHSNSNRSAKTWVTVNCAAIPESLIESTLFGHVKGSFTDAKEDKRGLFEEADGGTIFLDEIGSMPLMLQSKLLRVLQEREIRRVGSTTNKPINVRVIAASNENLEEMVSNGQFRQDLYFRLAVITLELPPLRERREDILPLANHFLRRKSQEGNRTPPNLTPEAKIILENYAWPGNVRELENAINRAYVICDNEVISREDFDKKLLRADPATALNLPTSPATTTIQEEWSFSGKSLKGYIREKEQEYLSKVLDHFQGDKEKAADAVGISLATLYRKLPDPI